MKRSIAILLIFVSVLAGVFAEGVKETVDEAIDIKVLILPKFENGEIQGDFPGEGQLYYEAYCMGGEEYDIEGGMPGGKLYVKDGVALYVTGMGKVNSSNSVTAILSDDRFDFSDAYFLSTGCCGTATGNTTMGDVFVISATIDYDLGHHADVRDMKSYDENTTTWYNDGGYDNASYKLLNQDLIGRVYDLVKDTELQTTEKTVAFMAYTFDNAEWATREPMVQRGTVVTGDNYWKGIYDENNAILMSEFYGAPDAYTCTEMEDNSIAVALDRFGYLDRYIVIRDSVNMDVFMNGASPEMLWGENIDDSLASEDSIEAADIFFTARHNNFKVGSQVVDAIIDGTL